MSTLYLKAFLHDVDGQFLTINGKKAATGEEKTLDTRIPISTNQDSPSSVNYSFTTDSATTTGTVDYYLSGNPQVLNFKEGNSVDYQQLEGTVIGGPDGNIRFDFSLDSTGGIVIVGTVDIVNLDPTA